MMPLAPLKTTTALIASLSMLMPHTVLVAPAWAQEVELLCLDESQPPCAEGEPAEGTTPAGRAAFLADAAARQAAEADQAAILIAEAAAAAEAEALRLQQIAAETAANGGDATQAQTEADAALAEAARLAADAEAARTLAQDATAAAEGARAAADQAAEAETAQLAAEAEAARLAEEEAAIAEAQAIAVAEAAAIAAAEEAAAVAEAEAQAIAAAEAEAARLAAEELASAEAQAIAAAEAEAAQLAAEELASAAEVEAQAFAAAEAEAARLAAEQLKSAAEVEAQAAAADEVEAARVAEAEAARLAAEELAASTAAAAASADGLVDPTITEDYDAPAAAGPGTAEASRDVVEETLDPRSLRTSAQDFATTIDGPAADAVAGAAQDSGLSDFEKALLLGLGAVAIGSVLQSGEQVVANSGDRLVVEGTGGLTVYKDDDALLRQPGATVRTETFTDGSSRVTLDREDGSQVVTIRDARGRVLRRTVTSFDGTEYELFDDLQPEPAVNLPQLDATRPEPRIFSAEESDLADLRTALRQERAENSARTYSLRQIREIEQVRSLVPAIELDTVTFPSNSAAIPPAQVRKLLRLGILIEEMLLENPREMFLIEGHTDGGGSDTHNLALSDRRAESVALALTENFYIPPENLIVQGYGEAFPMPRTQATDERNRRVTARRITPLLRQIAEN